MLVKIEKINSDVCIPTKSSQGSSGYDIYIQENMVISAGERKLIKCGFKVEIPFGYEIQIRPRSGLAIKKGISVLNTPGTIDSDYRDEVGVILVNHSSADVVFEKNDRIAQMVLQKVETIDFEEGVLDVSIDRGGGFGHSDNVVSSSEQKDGNMIRVRYKIIGTDFNNQECVFRGAGNINKYSWTNIVHYIETLLGDAGFYIVKYTGSQDIVKIKQQQVEFQIFPYSSLHEKDDFLTNLCDFMDKYNKGE